MDSVTLEIRLSLNPLVKFDLNVNLDPDVFRELPAPDICSGENAALLLSAQALRQNALHSICTLMCRQLCHRISEVEGWDSDGCQLRGELIVESPLLTFNYRQQFKPNARVETSVSPDLFKLRPAPKDSDRWAVVQPYLDLLNNRREYLQGVFFSLAANLLTDMEYAEGWPQFEKNRS